MADATEIKVSWQTDRGIRTNGTWEENPVDLVAVLRRLKEELEARGLFVFQPLRVFRRTVPLVAGEPVWGLATVPERVPVTWFRVEQEMLR